MGNFLSPCIELSPNSNTKIIFWGGATRTLTGKHVAGEIMFEFPDKIVCHADAFFIGHSIPALSINDELKAGRTYFVLPIDLMTCPILSASSLAALSSSPKRVPMKFGESPFEYLKGGNGRVLIKVVPEFITRLISGNKEEFECTNPSNQLLCSTPELQKHYDQLVGSSKAQVWSPKLETISEYKIRYSPCRFIGLDWNQKEKEA